MQTCLSQRGDGMIAEDKNLTEGLNPMAATMAAAVAKAFLDYAASARAPRSMLLRAAGLAEADLTDQDVRIPVAGHFGMIEAAMAATGGASLLLRHVLDSRFQTTSIVGQIMYAAWSFPHSLAQLDRYGRLMAEVEIPGGRARFGILREGDAVWLVDNSPAQGRWMATEASVARIVSEFRRSSPEIPVALAL